LGAEVAAGTTVMMEVPREAAAAAAPEGGEAVKRSAMKGRTQEEVRVQVERAEVATVVAKAGCTMVGRPRTTLDTIASTSRCGRAR